MNYQRMAGAGEDMERNHLLVNDDWDIWIIIRNLKEKKKDMREKRRDNRGWNTRQTEIEERKDD